MTFLTGHWLAAALLVAAIAGGLLGRRSAVVRALALSIGLIALGGLVVPRIVGLWTATAGTAVLVGMLGVLLASGAWSFRLAVLAGAAVAIGLGGGLSAAIQESLLEAGRLLRSVELVAPGWLVLLALVPLVIRLSFRSLAGLGPVRRPIAIGLRCLLVTLLVVALAEPRLRRPNETLTVLFLVDRSLSIPQDIDPSVPADAPEDRRDRRWGRIKRFVNDAVGLRGSGHERDQAGVIVFGRRPRLVLPPSSVDKLFISDDMLANIDFLYTDIAAALKLALASFPEGTAKRVVLISDGNENLGNAEEQAVIARRNGVQIDVVPLAAGYRNENEVLVQSVEAPPTIEQGSRVPIRVLIRSANPRPVVGYLTLRQITEGVAENVPLLPGTGVVDLGPPPQPGKVQLRPGLNSFSFRPPTVAKEQSSTYEATFLPIESVNDRGEVVRGLPGDRVQNNTATTHIVARGQRRVLVIEATGKKGSHQLLIDRLSGAGQAKFRIHSVEANELPLGRGDLGLFLSNYDAVVLANVPAEELTDDQQEVLRANVYDQGCGLVMIGGPDSFGAGGWQNTPVEKALPVDCDIKALKVAGKGGLVLIMHASEMAEGNYWQKVIAKKAIDKLSLVDMAGVLYYDFNVNWHVRFQEIASSDNRELMKARVDRMSPGDMPDFDPFLAAAHATLSDPKHELAVKHVIVISDGDPSQTNAAILAKMKADRVTCTTVGVATHGAPENTRLSNIATSTGGKFYNVTNASRLPAIFMREARRVSQSFIHEKQFRPVLRQSSGPADKLSPDLPPLYGFVRTSLKPSALATMAIEGPPTLDQQFPILAYWQYGLGKVAAFTSDALTQEGAEAVQHWDRDWVRSETYRKFWDQVVGWSLRGLESGKLVLTTEYRDGRVRVVVDARDEKNRPMTDLKLEARVTTPGGGAGKPVVLKFEQKNSGQYEAEFKAEEAGSYFLNVQSRRPKTEIVNGKAVPVMVEKDGEMVQAEEVDSVRAGVTLPYSPEFADLESNTPLLTRLAAATGGQVYAEDDATLDRVARSGQLFREAPAGTRSLQPVWFWLVLLTGLGLVLDVGVRRVAVEPTEAWGWAGRTWDRLRGRGVTVETPQFIERLRSRKAAVGETLERERSARRFDAESAPAPPAPPVPSEAGPAPPPRPAVPPPAAPKPAGESEDYASRLLKAKRKAMEGREKPKDEEPPKS